MVVDCAGGMATQPIIPNSPLLARAVAVYAFGRRGRILIIPRPSHLPPFALLPRYTFPFTLLIVAPLHTLPHSFLYFYHLVLPIFFGLFSS